MTAADEIYDKAVLALQPYGCELNNGLTSHAPMVVEARYQLITLVTLRLDWQNISRVCCHVHQSQTRWIRMIGKVLQAFLGAFLIGRL